MALAGIVAQLGALREARRRCRTLAALAAAAARAAAAPPDAARATMRDGRVLLAAGRDAAGAARRWVGCSPRTAGCFRPASRGAWLAAARAARSADWTVSLIASPESERREALAELLATLLLVAGCIAALLLAMQWNVRRAFRPLAAIVRAIEGIEQRRCARGARRCRRCRSASCRAIANAIAHLAIVAASTPRTNAGASAAG